MKLLHQADRRGHLLLPLLPPFGLYLQSLLFVGSCGPESMEEFTNDTSYIGYGTTVCHTRMYTCVRPLSVKKPYL